MEQLQQLSASFANAVWDTPLVVLLLGGGLFFAIYSRFLPYRHFGHAVGIMLGRHDTPDQPGELSHKQALAAALSGTMGLGNISGVALAIVAGGPGAIFWMWMSALVGIATKFFTCTLGVMYRGTDSEGKLQGGPMYIIREALPRGFYPLAVLFSLAGLIGTLPIFQANQLTALVRENLFPGGEALLTSFLIGCVMAAIVAMVIFGGLLGIILIGVSRGVFSNEAGVGTEIMAHGAAKTNEPIREGLVAMMGPVADTLIVCTCTALVILLAGTWTDPGDLTGITLTANAFRADLGTLGVGLLMFVTLILASTTMFTMWYYGAKCFGFLFGARLQHYYRWFFVLAVVFGASVSIDVVFNLISGSYGLMAIPTMVATLMLAGQVKAAAREYFHRHPY